MEKLTKGNDKAQGAEALVEAVVVASSLQSKTQAQILDASLQNEAHTSLDECLKECLELQVTNDKVFKVTKGLLMGHMKYRAEVQNKKAFKDLMVKYAK